MPNIYIYIYNHLHYITSLLKLLIWITEITCVNLELKINTSTVYTNCGLEINMDMVYVNSILEIDNYMMIYMKELEKADNE